MEQLNPSGSPSACHLPTPKYPQGRTGTDAGYQAHGKAGQPPCDPCRAARVVKGQRRWRDLSPEKRDEVRASNGAAASRYRSASAERAKRANLKYRERNREIIRKAKSKPCTDCKNSFPYYVMQFDHLGDKRFNIGAMGPTASRQKLIQEIAKCEIVCANCHAIRSHRRMVERGRITT